MVLGLFLILLVEPLFAAKAGRKGGAPRGGNARAQQVRRSGAGAAARTKAVQRSQPARTRPVAPQAKPRGSGNFRRPSKPDFRQSSIPNSSRPKVARPPAAFNASKHAKGSFNAAKHARGSFNATKHAQGSFNAAKHARGSFNAGKHAAGSFNAAKHARGSSIAQRPAGPASNSAGPKTVISSRPEASPQRPAKPAKPAKSIDSGRTARIASPIKKPKPALAAVTKVTGDRKPRTTSGKTVQSNIAPAPKPRRARIALKKGIDAKPQRKKMQLKSADKTRVAPRTKELAPQGRKTIRNTKMEGRKRNEIVRDTTFVRDSKRPLQINKRARNHERHRWKGGNWTGRYKDRHHRTRHVHRYEHVYRDRHDRLCHRIVWPRYRYPVYYNWGPYFTFRYVYPYHHRRYVFVSLGGYWPLHYRYARYYWYGCHPYYWYGYYPIAREVAGDTYNYYTYNYSYGQAPSVAYQPTDDLGVVDHTTFADVRERLAQQTAEPNASTPADTYFEEGVTAFEEGQYNTAAEKFAEAMDLASEDMVLPFAYAQALFANGQYSEAADALRSALENVSPEAEGVYYPRGLYTDDEVLLEQIDLLSKAAEIYTSDADLQLLLGYQLLGIGEVDEALEPLQQANLDLENKDSAEVLLNLLEKIKTEKPENADQ